MFSRWFYIFQWTECLKIRLLMWFYPLLFIRTGYWACASLWTFYFIIIHPTNNSEIPPTEQPFILLFIWISIFYNQFSHYWALSFIGLSVIVNRFLFGRFNCFRDDYFRFWFDFVKPMYIIFRGSWAPICLCICGITRYWFDLIKIFNTFVNVVIIVKNEGRFFHIFVIVLINIIKIIKTYRCHFLTKVKEMILLNIIFLYKCINLSLIIR